MDSAVRLRTLVLVNLASILERADEALLPAVYKEIGVILHAGPLSLGTLTFFRAFVQALSSPLAAYLSLRHDRASIIAFGAAWWGLATLFVGMSSSYWAVAAARAANGVGLAIVVPAIQSLVADFHVEDHRGSGFGWLHASGQVGTISGGIFATVMASQTFFGLPGWRWAFVLMAFISFSLAIGLYLFAKDPRPDVSTLGKKQYNTLNDLEPSLDPAWDELTAGILQVVRIRTFQVIVAQGVVGQIPWNAMVFFTLWMELLGFSHGTAALLVALLSVGNMIGSVFGGFLGDWAALKHPSAGRIICAQFSAGIGIPLSAILLAAVPDTPEWAPVFGLIFFTMGFCMSWNSPACNWPILSEIVPSRLRTIVFALSSALEKCVAALGAPLGGLLAQKVYGFKLGSHDSAAGTPPTDRDLDNAQSLAKGIFLAIGVPFAMCVVLITGLYWTYPGDRGKARIQLWVDNAADVVERGEIELESQWVESRKGEGNFDDDWWSESNQSSRSSDGSKSPLQEASWEKDGRKIEDGGEVDVFEGAEETEQLLGGNGIMVGSPKESTSS